MYQEERVHSEVGLPHPGVRTSTAGWVYTSILHCCDDEEFCFLQGPSNKSEVANELHYASVHFSKNQSDPVYSNIGPSARSRDNEEDEESTEYTVVKCDARDTSPR